jgi:hypothetical protein
MRRQVAHVDDIVEFIARYTEADEVHVAFSWNGKHASEFRDANQAFRWLVVRECVRNPGVVPAGLLEALFRADSEWSAQAWGAPHHFAQLGAALLEHGKHRPIEAFARGCASCFDTWGACHNMDLPPSVVELVYIAAKEALLHSESDELSAKLEAVSTLMEKLREGKAASGWVTVAPGTPVSGVRVVWPRWYHTLWQRLASAFRGGTT